MRKLNRKYYSFLQSLLCSFEASNIIPFNVWFLHHNGTYNDNDTVTLTELRYNVPLDIK